MNTNEKITIACPQCGGKMRVSNNKAPDRIITCVNPECNFKGSLMLFHKVKKITITCPSCGKQMKVSEDKDPNREITCINPECNFRGSLLFFHKENDSSLHTNEQKVSPQSNKTIISTNDQLLTKPQEGILRVNSTGDIYPISEGSHIVGRAHPTGHADIAIICNDDYMSRHHLRIDAISTPNGIEYRMSDNNSTNKVRLNGKYISSGDVIVLKENDKIVIGRTELQFILQ